MTEINPYESKPVPETPPAGQSFQPGMGQGDATGGVIPYKNAPALIGYYTGIFSLLPCIGFPLGFVAVVLGIVGLRRKSKHPEVKGTAHAIVALCCGAFSIIVYGFFLIMMLIGMTQTV